MLRLGRTFVSRVSALPNVRFGLRIQPVDATHLRLHSSEECCIDGLNPQSLADDPKKGEHRSWRRFVRQALADQTQVLLHHRDALAGTAADRIFIFRG